ncbi:MAG: 1,4-dihydroxy-2-naphthoyl-CoA hydrolase [Enterovirga sp.]|jgi:4-hydroxybenzoyl-CoA thioesterase|nr:1,4-dihydroxy-2-naphthoyl-CoA hydrolase [Enterovirga sp.]
MNAAVPGRISPPPFETLAPAIWRTNVRIRFSHCDPAGIVYFARYFDIINGVVEDWFSAALGLDYGEFIGPRRIGLGYANCTADFVAPGFMGDTLTFAVLIARIGGASLGLEVPAYRDGAAVLLGRMTIVTTSLVEHRAIPLPDDLRAAVTRYEGECLEPR